MSEETEAAARPVILIVDDEDAIRGLVSELLREEGYTVVEAATGSEALAAMDLGLDIQALFTDVHMPGSPDGLALARRVRELCQTCAIVIASGRGAPSRTELASDAVFMRKPYSIRGLVQELDRLLAA